MHKQFNLLLIFWFWDFRLSVVKFTATLDVPRREIPDVTVFFAVAFLLIFFSNTNTLLSLICLVFCFFFLFFCLCCYFIYYFGYLISRYLLSIPHGK